VNLKIVLLFVGNVVFNAAGNIMMKRGMNAVKDVPLNRFNAILSNLILNPLLIISAGCYVLSLIFYIFVLQKVSLNIAYPVVVACTAILVNIAAQFILHESITLSQIAGCAAIISGIYLIVG
jgi:multidrug transporter EmrE-like cation transporter